MSNADNIILIDRYIDNILANISDTERVNDLLVSMNRVFGVFTPDEKVAILDWLVGRLVALLED
jgi:hypothetical protein